jgi:hypothetical protein
LDTLNCPKQGAVTAEKHLPFKMKAESSKLKTSQLTLHISDGYRYIREILGKKCTIVFIKDPHAENRHMKRQRKILARQFLLIKKGASIYSLQLSRH